MQPLKLRGSRTYFKNCILGSLTFVSGRLHRRVIKTCLHISVHYKAQESPVSINEFLFLHNYNIEHSMRIVHLETLVIVWKPDSILNTFVRKPAITANLNTMLRYTLPQYIAEIQYIILECWGVLYPITLSSESTLNSQTANRNQAQKPGSTKRSQISVDRRTLGSCAWELLRGFGCTETWFCSVDQGFLVIDSDWLSKNLTTIFQGIPQHCIRIGCFSTIY